MKKAKSATRTFPPGTLQRALADAAARAATGEVVDAHDLGGRRLTADTRLTPRVDRVTRSA